MTQLDPRSALVVVDMQNVFLAPDQVFGNPHALDIIPAVNRVAAAMRVAGGTVIWTWKPVAVSPVTVARLDEPATCVVVLVV